MNVKKDEALDNLVAWADVACQAIESGNLPRAETITELRMAIEIAWSVNDYKKGEPVFS